MKLTPKDLSSFYFCPYLYHFKDRDKVFGRKFSMLERNIIRAILDTEQSCLIKDREVSTSKIIRKWDTFWWPEAAKNNLSIGDAEKLSIKASSIFKDYSKYDITGYMYPTIATRIKVHKEIFKDTILSVNIPILKVNRHSKHKNCVIVDFRNKKTNTRELALDIGIQSMAWSLFDYHSEIQYISFYLSEKEEKINLKTVVFRKDDLQSIEKNIKYITSGIKNKLTFMNQWNCNYCKQCTLYNF